MNAEPTPRADAFAPDSPVVRRIAPSPNHGPRPDGQPIDMLVLHYTGMASPEAALDRLRDPLHEVSSHYLVMPQGEVIQLVPENRRAWHAGQAGWAGRGDLNSCSIGIEIAHPGHQGGLPPYPAAQIAAVMALSLDIVARRPIAPRHVLGHSDIAPDRKEDPGETFPWESLHAAGIGHWVPPAPIRRGPTLGPGDRGDAVLSLRTRLAAYGYPLARSDIYDSDLTAVIVAFQRHFRQARVDRVADMSTVETLAALLAGCPQGTDG